MNNELAAAPPNPQLLVSKAWIQWAALVVLVGFFVLGILAYRTYVAGPPIPALVVAEDGTAVFSGEDVKHGQRIFLRAGLMEFGSVFGHGAYPGPDFTADYLRRSALSVTATYERADDRNVASHVVVDFKTNRYDPESGTMRFTAAQALAFADAERHYEEFFARPATETGVSVKGLSGPADIHALTSFFAWTAWVASTERPGKSYSYTNNWPPEPLVRNQPTAAALVYFRATWSSSPSACCLWCGSAGSASGIDVRARSSRAPAEAPSSPSRDSLRQDCPLPSE